MQWHRFHYRGSSGAAHADWVALDLEDTTDNGWGLGTRPKAVGTLSGSFDLSSRDADTQEQIDRFVDIAINYTNKDVRDSGDPDQYAASAISRIALINAADIPPMRLYNSDAETMPHQQMDQFKSALNNRGFVNVVATQIEGALHAFHYWHTEITPGVTIGQDVITFLNTHLL